MFNTGDRSLEIFKSLAPLEEMSRVSCPKRFSMLEMKMGHSGQDELVGKSGITLDEKKRGVVSCGPFPIPLGGRNA